MTRSDAVPETIRSYIARTIDSVGCLEVLLLLRASPQKEWTNETVSSELRSNPNSARMHLQHLLSHGQLQSRAVDGKDYFVYGPSLEDQALADELERQYHSHRVTVIGLIYERGDDRVRMFSDAFKLRKD